MRIVVTATNLDTRQSANALVQQLTEAIRSVRGKPIKVDMKTRDDMTGIDITRILPNRN